MAKLSKVDAAKAAGVSRQTLYTYIKGDVSDGEPTTAPDPAASLCVLVTVRGERHDLSCAGEGRLQKRRQTRGPAQVWQ